MASTNNLGSPSRPAESAAAQKGSESGNDTAALHLEDRLRAFKIDPDHFWDVVARADQQLVLELHTIR
jgi:hypothetical protein